ncbi:MAG: glycosyltransferase [Myxococcales bacterium]|nr:glycosyltransferase [Myxococcales bacterium]MDH3483170.1 glycosyltransferase [Myxococcales bacterium]
MGVSQGVADEAAEVFDMPPTKVVAILNPPQSRDVSFEIDPKHAPLFERPVVLGIGRLAPQKDFEMLLQAFATVSAGRDLHLVILGEGRERGSLQATAHALGLSERVFFPGFVGNPQAYLRRARVFALSSRNEGFPGALIEAMEAGTAIVSTDCNFGPREILDDERFGRLVPVGDAERLGEALDAELDALDVGLDARRAERASWLRRFDPERIISRYLEVVREVIPTAQSL